MLLFLNLTTIPQRHEVKKYKNPNLTFRWTLFSELLNGERRWRRAVPPAARAAAAEDFEMLTAAEIIEGTLLDSNFMKK